MVRLSELEFLFEFVSECSTECLGYSYSGIVVVVVVIVVVVNKHFYVAV